MAINSSNKSFLAAEILPNSVKEQISIKSTLSLPNYFPTPIPPKVPEGGADQFTNITGSFGIAYVPKGFSFNAVLKEDGEQTIPLTKTSGNITKFNVGVRDKTRKKDQN